MRLLCPRILDPPAHSSPTILAVRLQVDAWARAMGCSESKELGAADNTCRIAHSQESAESEAYQPLTQEEVNARIQSCERTLTHRLGDSGITLRCVAAPE